MQQQSALFLLLLAVTSQGAASADADVAAAPESNWNGLFLNSN